MYTKEQLKGRIIYDAEKIRFGKDTIERAKKPGDDK